MQGNQSATKKLSKKGNPGSLKSGKTGINRRLKHKSATFEENMYKKLDGQEIPETLKVRSGRN